MSALEQIATASTSDRSTSSTLPATGTPEHGGDLEGERRVDVIDDAHRRAGDAPGEQLGVHAADPSRADRARR